MSDEDDRIALLERRLMREREARRQAEALLEAKSRSLYEANARLRELNDSLEATVRLRTRELAEAMEAALEASRAKSMFLANMSHEFRTPLNAIIGYTELLREEAEEQGLAEFLDDLSRVHAAARHLLSLINDVLDLSKIEAGGITVVPERFDVAAVLESVTVTVRPIMERGGNGFHVHFVEGSCPMHTDATKVRQCLINLLSNAAKFTKGGNVELQVAREKREDRDGVRFCVTDTGSGIEDVVLPQLFTPFTQGDPTTTRRHGGTGLGLAITARFCELLGGDVAVQSAPGRGSTFTVWLPTRYEPPK